MSQDLKRRMTQKLMPLMKRSLLQILMLCCLVSTGLLHAAQSRFDSYYFFQTEEVLKEKKVNFEDMARFSRNLQSQVWKVLKAAKIKPGTGYLVVAVRSDQEVAVWFDMEPALHEYYENAIAEVANKIRPFHVESGVVVFAVKLSIDTAKHTDKAVPEPKAWLEAKQKLGAPDNIEEVVLSIWPE